ncbi:aconitase family-domain-containing protein [Multifurca ochricompacta]|uniref:Aconitase family-domain-containing protein n=1 Tax=Multifurca ochricompacta TaxID=376703 RepID=A0AAD4MC33_9AGAM|nr:aconitase family-domain-containing protein [Multifurca ochricompacta]
MFFRVSLRRWAPSKLTRSLATHASDLEKACLSITPPYAVLMDNLAKVRKHLNRPLTLAEKILYSHLYDPENGIGSGGIQRGATYIQLQPERVAMQDASAHCPHKHHCDHLIQASTGADADLQHSVASNQEVFEFLESAAKKYGIEFWRPGSGIIHQIPPLGLALVKRNALSSQLPVDLKLADSHTPNAGGLGMLAIGVGGADAVDAMTGTPWELKAPQIVGIHVTGKLNDWATPKDLILYLAGKLTVKGGTGRILEYFGPGIFSQSCTGLATIANMGAEVGATTSTFPYTPSMQAYLHATRRGPVARAADEAASNGFLSADTGAEYDELIEIDLSSIEPTINGPFTPDLATPLSKFASFVQENGWKDRISAGLIGSCTNSSYEDMTRVADIARQAKAAGLSSQVPFLCTPGSEQIRATMERDKITEVLEEVGAVVLANACGPCIGQWKREDTKEGANAILTSFNRNFKSRNDGNSLTMNFLASPTIFKPPLGQDLPSSGFALGDISYRPSPIPDPQPGTVVKIRKDSQRLEILEPFPSHFKDSPVLELPKMKGPWLKYKGHLTNISENLLITAVNDENGEVNVAFHCDHDPTEPAMDTIPGVAKKFKARRQPWALIVDENYGEGSAREHAALQPRFYGCAMIIARSFARIHETNLKARILPLWFADKNDYGRIGSGAVIETIGVADLFSGKPDTTVRLKVATPDGESFEIATKHTMSSDQLKWLRAGSALNHIRSQLGRR